MESCPTCKEIILKIKILKCKFCDKKFCSLNCLIKHSSFHSKIDEAENKLVNSLKRKYSFNLTVKYPFLTNGNYYEKSNFKNEFSLNNFSNVIVNSFPKEIGSGSFGTIYLMIHNQTKKEYALKVIEKNKVFQLYGSLDIIYNEIKLHSKLEHKNIIRLYNMHEDTNNINIIMEYAKNGNLFEMILNNKQGFSEGTACEYFIQVVNALYFLHQNNIIHRDIKPENILISDNGIIKLCDFGWARELNLENRSTFCGTMGYMAPEIASNENYDFSVDIWSIGILLYELIFGHLPFKGKDSKEMISSIKIHGICYDKPISNECKDLIERLLCINPHERLRVKDIINHPFIIKYCDKKNKQKQFLTDPVFKIEKRQSIETNSSFHLFQSAKTKSFNHIENGKMEGKEDSIRFFASAKIENIDSVRNESSIQLQRLKETLNLQLKEAKKNIENFNFIKEGTNTFEKIRDKAHNKKNISKGDNKIKKITYEVIPPPQKAFYDINIQNENKTILSTSKTEKTDDDELSSEEFDYNDYIDENEGKTIDNRLNKVYYQLNNDKNRSIFI